MRTLDEIAAEASDAGVKLRINTAALTRASATVVDGLFHTPLLALTILVIARGRRSGLMTNDLTTWTLGTLSKHFESLKLARGRLQWSLSMRTRCADALVFLENIGLVSVQATPTRAIHLSVNGRDFVRKQLQRADEAGVLTRQLERAHRAVQQGGLELL